MERTDKIILDNSTRFLVQHDFQRVPLNGTSQVVIINEGRRFKWKRSPTHLKNFMMTLYELCLNGSRISYVDRQTREGEMSLAKYWT